MIKKRVVFLQIAFLLAGLVIFLRLGYWQVISAGRLQDQALAQRQTGLELPALRGEIKTSDGFFVAGNKESYLMYSNPRQFPLTRAQQEELLDLLPATDSARIAKALNADLSWSRLTSDISAEVRAKIEQLDFPGIGFELDPKRYYPEGSISAHLTGFVGRDEAGRPKGYFGLEGFYDRKLSGRAGKIVEERDGLGRPISIGQSQIIPSQDGEDLTTSIDRILQFIVFKKLQAGLERYQAVGGTVTIMDPKTGKIMAMASLPNYDPSDFVNSDPSLFGNPVVAESFEPGSTFKTIIMASALDSRVVTPETKCDICDRAVRVADYTIRTWDDKYHPDSTMTEVLKHSDNVGMVFISRKLGRDKLRSYLKKFGFGQKTGIDLQEESEASLRPDKQWLEIDLATTSFGQGIAVTPIQMVRAVAAIANLGKLPTPQVAGQTKPLVSIISAKAASQVTQMMIASVEQGEAKWAKPKGYTVAGKTGTAQIPVAGHYDADKTIASFVGFAPASDPKFVMLVTIKEPKSSPWGSETAAPLWFEIAGEIFRHLRIPPQ